MPGAPTPRPLAAFPRIVGLALACALPGCGGSGSSPPAPTPAPVGPTSCAPGGGPTVSVSGTVRYERLPISPAGLGPGVITRPARFVDVELLDASTLADPDGPRCYAQTSTDGGGAYVLTGAPPAGALVVVRVASRTDLDPARNVTVHDALPPSQNVHTNADCFRLDAPAFTAGSLAVVDLTVPWNPGSAEHRPSIGFALLDVLLGCAERIRTTTGETPPLCHAYTRLGNAGATGTSFYADAAKALTILGGSAGQLDATDTDYFDDGVIAHEYGHFVEFNMAASRNRGGPHSGEALEPPFAWSEGAATGFGCLLRQDAAYVDTLGTAPGPTLLDANAENWTPQLVRGIGGEETVVELVWDLGDGATGVADADGDPAAVAFGTLYGRFLSFDAAVSPPYLGTLLDGLVAGDGVPAATITALMTSPADQQITYPLAGADIWPVPLAVPGSASGACDSLSGPNKNPCRGLSSSVWYAFTLGSPQTLTFTLTIGATPGDGDDLDLVVETAAGTVLGSSNAAGAAPESIGPLTLGPGRYVVRVEADCAGAGNQATFTLQVL